ncbi:MAG: 16S rRNA (adenine(1518)-N(6)/adenine(1519)-N(6))-dimethyltransferase RsmA [Candidatus Portnoybacteria bacterium]|nr:16S rRNA (adenine(1518)-N(6)/adenine(1519)-N(6))-dimethyltransferase RsmA [Candidatus Portnoybacteria bacterium]
MKNCSTKKEFQKIKPNKLLGQNFLVDKNVLAKIIAAADLFKNDTVLEVGPGKGILTRELAVRASRVVAVEKDRRLAPLLQESFKNAENIKIVQADILKFLKSWPVENYKVVANIPYYLTSRLIRLLLESPRPPRQIVLLVQQEVAQRICSKPPEMSLLAIAVQFYAQTKIIAKVPRGAFWPRPRVDSAIIKITPYGQPCDKSFVHRFFRLAKAGFSQPRKQLQNNLRNGLKIDQEKISAALKSLKIKPTQRAESLTLDNWLKLVTKLPDKNG